MPGRAHIPGLHDTIWPTGYPTTSFSNIAEPKNRIRDVAPFKDILYCLGIHMSRANQFLDEAEKMMNGSSYSSLIVQGSDEALVELSRTFFARHRDTYWCSDTILEVTSADDERYMTPMKEFWALVRQFCFTHEVEARKQRRGTGFGENKTSGGINITDESDDLMEGVEMSGNSTQ